MEFQKIVCVGFTGQELEQNYWDELDRLTKTRVIADEGTAIESHSDADALLVKLGAKISQDTIAKFPHLKYIGMLGTGYGGIDTSYSASKEITVTNIADYATEGVAEFTFGLLLEYFRDLSKARTQANNGDYSDDFSGGEIKRKKFGVIGLGDIGRRTAQLAQAFGAEVCYWSRNRKLDFEAQGITYCDLDELIASCDIVTLNLALNAETERIINAERIAKIKHHAVVVNPSPMELVDFDALVARLNKKDIVFILDHSDEMTDVQLKELAPMDNAIVYPAIGYITYEAAALKKRIYIDNLKNFLSGSPTNKVS